MNISNGNILTASQGSQIRAIKSTQRGMDAAQMKLASGRDVNSVLDNPKNFFASFSLNNKAGDLSRLLDGIAQSIRTIQGVNNSLLAAQKLIDQAEALLMRAETDLYLGAGEPDPNIVPNSAADFVSYAGGQDTSGGVTLDNNNHDIHISGDAWKKIDFDYRITEHTVLRFEYQSTITPEISAIGFDNDDVFNNNANFFFLHGTQFGGIAYAAPINTYQYDDSGEVVQVEIPVGEYFTGDFSHLTFINDHDIFPSNGDAMFRNVTFFETNDTIVPTDRSALAAQYEADYAEITKQLDALVEDSHYLGVNLLDSDNLTTDFNVDYTASLKTEGIDATSTGLGLEEKSFQRLSLLKDALSQVREARKTLRTYNSSIANDLDIIQTRHNFTRRSMDIFKNGSDDLTRADLNEAGADLLSLQTRQQMQFLVLGLSQTSIADFLFKT